MQNQFSLQLWFSSKMEIINFKTYIFSIFKLILTCKIICGQLQNKLRTLVKKLEQSDQRCRNDKALNLNGSM